MTTPAPPPVPFVPLVSAPRFADGTHRADVGVVAPAVAGGDGAAPYLLALPCIMRVLAWGLLVLMMVVPSWAWLVRTDHALFDSVYAATVSWAPGFAAFLVVVWQVVLQLHGQVWRALPMAVGAVGVAGMCAGDRAAELGVALVRSELAFAVGCMRAVARSVLHVPRRVPWLALAFLGAYVHMAQSCPAPSMDVAYTAQPLPPVVHCSHNVSALCGGGTATMSALCGGVTASGPSSVAAFTGGGGGWAARLPAGTWVVDSGAELMIAGSFIYEYSAVVLRKPDVSIKGVDGSLTPVDSVVRTMVRLPDGDHCVSEVLVRDSFEIALWSTEYMARFGFDTLLLRSGGSSVVRTPSGCEVPLQRQPYRLYAPCRVPSDAEFASGASCGSSAMPVCEAEVAAVKEKGPLRVVTEEEAWLLHGALMHAGWRTVSETFRVRVPSMPRCPVCEVTKSKRKPQPGHEIKSTFAGQLTHSDTWGPFCCALYYRGCRYIVVFVNDYSRVKLPVFCKDRTSATLIAAYKVWHAFMSSLGCPPTGTWQSDGGPEYVSEEAYDFCDEHAIQRLLSVRYVPTGNGVAESAFRVHIPRARAALRACGGCKELYALSVQHSMWLGNRQWSKQLGGCPFDLVPHPPPVVHEQFMDKPFGCRMWAHLPHVNVPHKMADTAREGCFVGMSEVYKGVIFYCPRTHDFDASVHAKFDSGLTKVMPMLAMAAPPSDPAPLPPPLPLPPLFVPQVSPVVAPDIPPVPLPMPPTPARDSVPVSRVPGRDEPLPQRRPLFASGLVPAAPHRYHVPVTQPAPLPRAPLPAPLPPPLPPRRPGARTTAEERQAVQTPVPGAHLAVVMMWLASTAPGNASGALSAGLQAGVDGQHVSVLIFSGVESTLAACLRARGARVLEIDVAVGGRLHDLTNATPDGIGWHLRQAAQRGQIHSLHAAVPCETFSCALDDDDMVRSWPDYPMGKPRLSLDKATKLFLSNALVYYTVDLATDVYRAGGECTIENPSPRMDLALPHVFWAAKAHHANLFRVKPVLDYAAATGSVEITLPLCACGLNMQKYVTVLSTPKAARVLAPLHGLVCTCSSHPEHAYGLTSSGKRGALMSASYPHVFGVVLACALLQLQPPGVDLSGESPRVVPVALGVMDATGLPHLMVDTDHGVERSVTGWMFMFGGAAVSWAVRGQVMPSLSSAESELYGLSTGVCDLLTCVQVLEEMGLVFGTVTVATDSRGARLLAMDCAAAARTRHIHRRWYFVRYHIDEKHLHVTLVKGSANRSNFLTKPVGGAPFAADRDYALGGGKPPLPAAEALSADMVAVPLSDALVQSREAPPVAVWRANATARVPALDVFSSPKSRALQCSRVRVADYTEPSGPGWWSSNDDGDLSDEEDGVFSVQCAGVSVQYQACVKVPVQACKAAVRTRFSTGPDGNSLRHDIPRGYDEASRHPEAAAIWEAMLREMSAHEDCGTWDMRPATECYAEGRTPIECMWVYDCKVDATADKFLMWKARLVGRGDQMVYLRDYMETYSGVCRHSTFRMFLAVCAVLALVVTGADVSTAYLHAPLRDYCVWMKVPRGFPAVVDGVPMLCRLKMALYGLKQSAREWALTLIGWLLEWGFTQCCSDRYMFVYDAEAGKLIVLVWVDDIFIGHSSDELRAAFMAAFAARFRVKDLGRLQQALGASVSQSLEQGWVSFNLSKYISDLARRFDLHDNVAWADIPVPLQLAKECRSSKPTDAEVRAVSDAFGVLAGSVTFIATFARPDVAYAAHLLSTFMARPGPVHMKLARRVLGYLSRTRDLAIVYHKGKGDMSMSFKPLDAGGD